MWCSSSEPTLALKRNRTKWPGRIRKLILDSNSDSEVFDFWPCQRKKNEEGKGEKYLEKEDIWSAREMKLRE